MNFGPSVAFVTYIDDFSFSLWRRVQSYGVSLGESWVFLFVFNNFFWITLPSKSMQKHITYYIFRLPKVLPKYLVETYKYILLSTYLLNHLYEKKNPLNLTAIVKRKCKNSRIRNMYVSTYVKMTEIKGSFTLNILVLYNLSPLKRAWRLFL